jgi:hypothetical protein
MLNRKLLAAILSVSLLFTSACALGELLQVTADAVQNQPSAAAPTPTMLSPVADPTAERAPTLPSGVRLDAGLEALQSYRASLTMKFSGKNAQGKTVNSTLQVIEEINRAEDIHHLLSHSDLQGERPGSVDIYQVGQAVYVLSSEVDNSQAGCQLLTQDSLAERTRLTLRPTDLFDNIWRGKLLAKDEASGDFTADHYELGGAQLRLGIPEKISGSLWISKDLGYTLRFTGSAEGVLSLGFGTTYGQVQWEYKLSEINQVSISLPPDCLALAQNDLPVPVGASDMTQSGSRLSFRASPSPAALIEYYSSELTARGWTLQKGSSDGKTFQLAAEKDGLTLEISVITQENGSLVTLLKK